MKSPKISIIVPIYNAEKYLHNCINSVLNQEYINFELLLIDDGSNDSSLNICKQYENKDKRIILIHKNNEGRCKTRNLGISKAKGKYIAFLDNDDLYDKYYLKDMIELLEKYNADISCCKYIKFNNDNNIDINNKINNNVQVYEGNNILKEYFHNRKSDIYANVWTKIYKRELFENILFDNETFEDLFVTYKLLDKANTVVCTDNYYYLYNIGNTNSLTYKFNRKLRIRERELYIKNVINYFKNNQSIQNELNYHIMEEKISIHNDILHCDIKTKDLINKQKEIRIWINSNLNNKIYSFKDKVRIIMRVYFHNLWHLYRKH